MKKTNIRSNVFRASAMVLAVSAALLSSCKLPPTVNWANIRRVGLIPALNGEGEGEIARTRPVKVDPVMTPKVVEIPIGEPVPNRPGFVYTPHTNPKRIVDVRDFLSGEEVRCPITLKPFTVPDFTGNDQPVIAQDPAPVGPEIVSVDPTAGLERLHEGFDKIKVDPAARTEPPAPEVKSRPKSRPQRESKPNPEVKPKPAPEITPLPEGPMADLPVGRRVPGRAGFVFSPFASQYQLVDVAGIAPGVEVKCPYTGKLFRVPEPLPEESGTTEKKSDTPQEPNKEESKNEVTQPEPKKEEPKKEAPKSEPKPLNNANSEENLPTATWAQKDKGLVQSPYGASGQLVDVTQKAPGSKVVCPFTGKPFVVPAP